MTRTIFGLGVVVALGTTVAMFARAADEPKSPEAAKQAARCRGADLLGEAYRLAAIGEQQQMPEAYIFAGGLILKLNALTKGEMSEITETPTVVDEKNKPITGAKLETQKPQSLDSIVEDFFDSAVGLGSKLKTSKEVDALIKATKGFKYDAGTRGSAGGPETISRKLAPGEAHHYTFKFFTREPATIGVSGNRTSRLIIENDDGDSLYNDIDSYHNYHWTPRGSVNTKTFEVTVRNTHDYPVNYRLWKN